MTAPFSSSTSSPERESGRGVSSTVRTSDLYRVFGRAGSDPRVFADPRYLRIAFERLIEDSLQSLGEGKQLLIAIETVEDQHILTVDEDSAERHEPHVSREFGVCEVPDLEHHSGRSTRGSRWPSRRTTVFRVSTRVGRSCCSEQETYRSDPSGMIVRITFTISSATTASSTTAAPRQPVRVRLFGFFGPEGLPRFARASTRPK